MRGKQSLIEQFESFNLQATTRKRGWWLFSFAQDSALSFKELDLWIP